MPNVLTSLTQYGRTIRHNLSRHRDKGAVTTVVTALLGGGVLLGCGAIVVDVGQLYTERAELQRGADAAAIAVAKVCALHPAQCTLTGSNLTNLQSKATEYADDNAEDGSALVTSICIVTKGPKVCYNFETTGAETDLTQCINNGAIPTSNYVEIRTATLTADNQRLVPPILSKALLGNASDNGHAVHACARAAWGAPGGAMSTLAFTISTCEWNYWTGTGTNLPSPEAVLYIHDSSGSHTCPAGPSGWDAPGGFGWLDEDTDDSTTCQALISDTEYSADPGVSAPSGCKEELEKAIANQSALAMSVFDGIKGTGNNTMYHLAGYSIFIPTGYYFSASKNHPSASGFSPCSGNQKCLYGYFTTKLVHSETINATATNYGAMATSLIG